MPLIRLGVGCNLLGLAVMALASALLSGMGGFWVYTLGFLLVQFGNNYATAPYSALIPDLIPEEQRGRYSGVMGVLSSGGQLLGGLSFAQVQALHLPNLASYALMGLALLLFAWVTLRGVPEPQRVPQPTPASWRERLGLTGLARTLRLSALFVGLCDAGFFRAGAVQRAAFPQLLRGRRAARAARAGTVTIALLLLIIVGAIVTALLGGKLSDEVGRKPIIYVAGALMAACALALLWAPGFWAAAALALAFGLGYGAFTSVDWSLGSDAMPSRATYVRDMAVWHVAFVGPQLITLPRRRARCWTGATPALRSWATRWCSGWPPPFSYWVYGCCATCPSAGRLQRVFRTILNVV